MGALTRETLGAAAARGVVLVPTLSVVEHMLLVEDEAKRDRAKRRVEAAREAFARALAAGVRIACGTDIGCFPHAVGSRRELALMVDYGMPELAALRSATREAADLVRLPQLGRLEAGAVADLCAFAGTTVLAALREAPTHVLQAGRFVREPSTR